MGWHYLYKPQIIGTSALNCSFISSVIFGLFLPLMMNVLFEFQSNWSGSSYDSVQSRRVVISHNMDKALKEGES